MRKFTRLMLPMLALLLLIAAGCSKPEMRCTSPEDNPSHHYLTGMESYEQGNYTDAYAKFEKSVWCDDSFGPGYAGLAIVQARAASVLEPGVSREETVYKASKNLEKAYDNAYTHEELFAYYVASIRVNTMLKPRNWVRTVDSDYKKMMKLKVEEKKLTYYDGREGAAYFAGLAYLEAGDFQKARGRFGDVLNARKEGKWNEKADLAWKKTDRIVRALSGVTLGDVGKEIAVKDTVSRGDMAALLADELKIDKLFAGRIPVKSEVERKKPEYEPVDVQQSPFKQEILTMMKWGIRGLAPRYDEASRAYLFEPDKPVLRKDFAFALEDILIKLTGDESMASAYFGHQHSPFPDVPPTSAWYNAIMNVTTRNIMETSLSGEFRPDDVVDGADAVLAIRVLRQRLNIY